MNNGEDAAAHFSRGVDHVWTSFSNTFLFPCDSESAMFKTFTEKFVVRKLGMAAPKHI